MASRNLSLSEAMERFNTDAAGIWELVAAGRLTATRPDITRPWVFQVPR